MSSWTVAAVGRSIDSNQWKKIKELLLNLLFCFNLNLLVRVRSSSESSLGEWSISATDFPFVFFAACAAL